MLSLFGTFQKKDSKKDMKTRQHLKVNYIFRAHGVAYSIERVFEPLINRLCKEINIQKTYVPNKDASVGSLIGNMIYCKKRHIKGYINHVTGDVHYLTLALPRKNTIITVHDIGLVDVLKGCKRAFWNLLWLQTLKRARLVICISEHSKKELCKHIRITENQIRVIPNPISPFFKYSEKEFNHKKPIILHIGVGVNKNLKRTILALKGINCRLRIIGKLDNQTIELLEKNNIDYSNAVDLSDSEIIDEYVKSDIVSFPSLHEGFGMPIVEGQAIGRVILTSDRSPMKEIAGGGAYLVDPENIASIHDGYVELINNSFLRDKLIQIGQENIKKYDVETVAKLYMETYSFISEKLS